MMPYIQSILVGIVNICEWMKERDCKRIIFNTTPSDVLETWDKKSPIEDDAERSFPKDGQDHAVYTICKRAATDILEHMSIAENFKPCIFRHFTVYGWHPQANYFLNGEERILPWRLMIRKCIAGEDLEVWGNPTIKKELLYIKDFARAVVRAVETDCCGIFNLPGYKPYSMEEMVDGILSNFGNGKNKKIMRSDMPNTPKSILSHIKSEKVLGWNPIWTWDMACEDIKKEIIENPVELMWGPVDLLDKIKE